jgi:hypothetical protein
MILQAIFSLGVVIAAFGFWTIGIWLGRILWEDGWRNGGKILLLLPKVFIRHFSFKTPCRDLKYLGAILKYLAPSRLIAGHLNRLQFLKAISK